MHMDCMAVWKAFSLTERTGMHLSPPTPVCTQDNHSIISPRQVNYLKLIDYLLGASRINRSWGLYTFTLCWSVNNLQLPAPLASAWSSFVFQ